jgi:lysophospholipase L1-like esterase
MRKQQSWWKREVGGMPRWGIAAAVAVLIGLSGAAVTMAPAAPSAASYTPRPMMTVAPEPPVALFIGDSFTAGAGASAPKKRWTTLAARGLGWIEYNRGLGGTGYVATSGVKGCGLEFCANYAGAIAGASNIVPNLVVISGGRNDAARLAEADVEATIRDAQQAFPAARIVVTNPIWSATAAPPYAGASVAAVHDAAEATGATYVDLGDPLGGHAEMIGPDGVHPGDSGHAAIANAFVSAWNALAI